MAKPEPAPQKVRCAHWSVCECTVYVSKDQIMCTRCAYGKCGK